MNAFTDKWIKPEWVNLEKGQVITIEELTKWAIETEKEILDELDDTPLQYHTCPQVLENNVLIWKCGGQWLFADSDRNRWGFSAHPRIIHICKYCGEVLN